MDAILNFFNQGGYAFYVWSAFGFTFALLIAEVLQLGQARRTTIAHVGRLLRLSAKGNSQ